MKKLSLLILLTLCFCLPLFSQNASDALRYSRIIYGGTARFQGLAGAFGAVGADFSTLATNPAGLGLYKGSEWSITPSGFISHSSSVYNGDASSATRGNFALGNIGFVLSIPSSKKSSGGFKNFNFGIGLNRQNDFNNTMIMQGPNYSSSMMTDWVNILNSQYLTESNIDQKYPFDIALATNANLIYLSDSANRIYANDAPNGGVYQQKTVYTYGSMNEFDISFGTNYDDKLYIGATIGIPFLRYFENNEYQEVKIDESIPYFRTLSYNQSLETHGTGINFKVGVIYRPANWVRIGAAIHTPTYYGFMRDAWSSSMFATYDSVLVNNSQYSPIGNYDYHMTTPFRAIGSIAFLIGQFGVVSGEYEYVNYNQARFSSMDAYEFDDVNTEIKSSYTAPVNIRCGTEWRIQDFRIRGGFAYSGVPYQNSNINNGKKYTASGGVGYRGRLFFVDLTYVWSQTDQEYYFYDSNLVNPVYNTITSSTILTTLGIRF
jgi:hypothetical protein